MAIQINSVVTTNEGLEVNDPYVFVDIYLGSLTRCELKYYKSKNDFKNNKWPLNIDSIPNSLIIEISNSEFWGDNLATIITQKCCDAIEVVLGADTCTIDETNPFE